MRLSLPALAALALLAFAVAPAESGLVARDRGTFGDRIRGDLFGPDEVDVFTGRAAAGSRLSLRLLARKPRRGSFFRPSLAILDESGAAVPLAPRVIRRRRSSGLRLRRLLLPVTGAYRMLVGTLVDNEGHPFRGQYRLTTKLQPVRRFRHVGAIRGPGGIDEVSFGLPADSRVSIFVKRGRALGRPPEILSLIGPGGDVLFGRGRSLREGRRVTRLRRLRLGELGVYRLRVRGDRAGEWFLDVRIRARRPKGRRVTLLDGAEERGVDPGNGGRDRAGGEPPAAGVLGLFGGRGQPAVDLPDPLSGGIEDWLFWPGRTDPLWANPPGTWILPSEDRVFSAAGKLVGYTFRSADDRFTARVSGIERTESEALVAFDVEVESPAGTTISSFSHVVRDELGRPVGWGEERVYEESGTAFRILVSGVAWGEDGGAAEFTAELTGPDGKVETLHYP